jgi:hypothetical protein
VLSKQVFLIINNGMSRVHGSAILSRPRLKCLRRRVPALYSPRIQALRVKIAWPSISKAVINLKGYGCKSAYGYFSVKACAPGHSQRKLFRMNEAEEGKRIKPR